MGKKSRNCWSETLATVDIEAARRSHRHFETAPRDKAFHMAENNSTTVMTKRALLTTQRDECIYEVLPQCSGPALGQQSII